MRTLVLLFIIGSLAWYGWTHRQDRSPVQTTASAPAEIVDTRPDTRPTSHAVVYTKCITADGRTLFGDIPAGTTCKTLETINSRLALTPGNTTQPSAETDGNPPSSADNHTSEITTTYTCDGRTHCSQMRSCEEATYFLAHCPNVEMDGNADGIPCERQWCK